MRYEKSNRTSTNPKKGFGAMLYRLTRFISGDRGMAIGEWWSAKRKTVMVTFLAILPGACLVALGLCVINAPELLAYAVASILVAFGVFLLIAGIRLVQLGMHLGETLNQLKDKFAIHTVHIRAPKINESGQGITTDDIKKIIIH